MKNLIIAWRNLWRNKRRTYITMASIFFGVLLSTLMSSMQEGMYAQMIDNVVKFYTGYIQIQHPDYWEKKTINNTFTPTKSINNVLADIDDVTYSVPRLESYSLISTGDNTKGGALIGIDPEKEDRLTGLKKWVHEGTYLEPEDDGILLTYNLAKNLEADIGDTLVLLSQGYHGASAEGLFPLRGILKFPSPQLNNMGGYTSLEKARDFFWAHGQATSIVIMLQNYDDMQEVKSQLQSEFGDQYGVLTWVDMQPELKQMIEGDQAGGLVMKAILYLLIGFGILGTVIMMLAERKKEFGVMVAIGMKKIKLVFILIYETILIGILGVAAGFIVSIPVISIFVHNPIQLPSEVAEAYADFGMEPVIYFSSAPDIYINQALTVFLITLIIALYPIINIVKLQVVKALKA